ncbi:MAG: response regulator transcription factor [Bacteroidia bacterium]|nr:response regulator transcription factor [Bacteroidia bacterium]NNC86650.1 response regulator transcription factor [Bacteroidia bacterium]NNM15856.1 response regulator transcription factor [Bacteroidia bacterium]
MSQQKIRIAIADDQVLFRESIASSINSFDNLEVVMQAGNGQELLEQIENMHNPIDIVLLDLNMPVLNGKEATKILREKHPEIRIVILSFHNEPAYIIAMVEIGINAYLDKNSSLDEVKECIESVQDKEYYFNQHTMTALRKGAAGKTGRKFILNEADALSERELEILDLVCKQHTTAEIAEKLFISKKTVEGHRNNLLLKTQSRNVAGLVVYAFKHQLVTVDL